MSKQVNAADVTVKQLEIRGASGRYDLYPHMQELSIYEDIFRPALTAKIVLSDSHNVPYKLPIVGEETVDIDIALTGFGDGHESETYSIKPPPLHVNSLNARGLIDPRQTKAQRYTLDLISETYMSSLHSKVSKSYNNKKISYMVSDIYHKYLSDDTTGLFSEPTERTESVIIPNLSPLKAIEWLSKRAIPNESNGINYVYFETVRGSFFMSLNTLVDKPAIFTFVQRVRIDDSTGVENAAKGIIKIKDFKFIKQFDKKENTQRGVYASKLITHDIVRKKIVQHEYGGFNSWFSLNHCGQFPPLSNSDVEIRSSQVARTTYAPPSDNNGYPTTTERNLSSMIDSRVEFYPKHDNMYSMNGVDNYDNNVENWKLKRNGHMGIYDGINILLEVSGNSALRVGMTANVYLPSPESTDKDKKSDAVDDKFLSGKYMVTAIQHIFTRIEEKIAYNMKVEVSKDGLEEHVPIRLSRKED
jgi:hypothetical protein